MYITGDAKKCKEKFICILISLVVFGFITSQRYSLKELFCEGPSRHQDPGRSRRSFLGIRLPWEKTANQKRKGFSPELQEQLNQALTRDHFHLVLNAGNQARLVCRTPIAKAILRDFPDTKFYWLVNNRPFTMEPTRMVFYQGVMVVQDIRVTDIGVYACVARYMDKEDKMVAVTSIMVDSYLDDFVPLRTSESRSLSVDCNTKELGRLYQNATKTWWLSAPKGSGNTSWVTLFNASKMQDLADLPVKPAVPNVIAMATFNMTGIWTCEVTDVPTGRQWLTARYYVVVDPPPTFLETVVLVAQDNPLETLLSVGSVLTVFLIFFLVVVYNGQVTRMKAEDKLKEIHDKIRALRAAEASADVEIELLDSETSSTNPSYGTVMDLGESRQPSQEEEAMKSESTDDASAEDSSTDYSTEDDLTEDDSAQDNTPLIPAGNPSKPEVM